MTRHVFLLVALCPSLLACEVTMEEPRPPIPTMDDGAVDPPPPPPEADAGEDAGEDAAVAMLDAGSGPTDAGPSPLPRCTEGSRRHAAPLTITAAAPSSITDDMLGRPVDENFTFVNGPDGVRLFPEAGVIVSAPNEFRHSIEEARSTRQLAANAQGWGIGAIEISADSEDRYAYYSAYQVSEVHSIDVASAMRDTPSRARWFVRSIQYGRQYSLVLRGSRSSFGVGAQTNLQTWGGSIEAYADTYGLMSTQVGRGLQPRSGTAIFARSPGEVEDSYEAIGEVAPLFVEYQSVPTGCVPDEEIIPWSPPVEVHVTVRGVYVENNGTVLGGDADWRLELSCRLNGRALSIDDNPIFERTDIDSGVNVPLDWSTVLVATYGDELRCSFGGRDLYWEEDLPVASFGYTPIETESEVTATVAGYDADYAYRVAYGLRMRPL